jgi:hypothetical protein
MNIFQHIEGLITIIALATVTLNMVQLQGILVV